MPTNFTVVPVKDGERKAKEGSQEESDDVDDNNVLKEEEGNATGQSGYFKRVYSRDFHPMVAPL